MENNSGSSEQKKDDDLHFLSTLLAKERSPELTEKVTTILSSDLALTDKIRQIQELDFKEENKLAIPEKSPKEDPEADTENNKKESKNYLSRPKKKPEPDKNIHSMSDYIIDIIASEAGAEVRSNSLKISQNRKMLKPFAQQTTFFRYFFSERRKIRNFADETGIIAVKRFGTKLILNNMVADVFAKNIKSVAQKLMKSLLPVLEQGWHYLDKRDYNLIVILYKLCRELNDLDFEKFNQKSINLIDRMPAAELLFLILHYESGDIKQLRYAVDTVYNKDPSKHELQKNTSVNIHKILDKDQMRPSLYNFIISLNIIKSKSFVDLQDLQKQGLNLIDGHDFNCTPKIRDKIDEYLRILEKNIQPYLDQEREVYRLQAFIPTDGKGVVDFSILKHFYDRTLQSRRLSFDKNKENIIKFIINMGYSFLINFRELLTESIEVEKEETVSLFAESIFGQDLSRIEFNLGKLDKVQTILPKFSTSRYLSLKKTMTGAIESEAEAIQIIDEISSTIVFMGKRIAHILRNALPDDHGSDNKINYFSFDEITYAIPAEKYQIRSQGYLKSFSVKQSLYEVAGICYQTGAIVHQGEISELLAKEKKIHKEILSNMKQYKKIAHEMVYKAFIEKYDLPH